MRGKIWGVVGIFLAGALGVILPARAEEASLAARRSPTQASVEEIAACMRANVVDRGSLRNLEIVSKDREGKTRAFKAKLFWKPKSADDARMTMQILDPEEFRGTAYLLISPPGGAETVDLYLPALDRVQRIAGAEMSQPLWGTDFTLAEIKQVQGLFQTGQTTRLADASVAERPTFVLDTKTDIERTGHTHVKSYVDQKTCTLLRSELFDTAESPRKILEADLSTLLKIDPWWLILGYRMRDQRVGTYTDIKLSDLFLLEDLPSSLFTPEGFHTPQH